MFNLRDAKDSLQRLRSSASVASARRRARLRDSRFTIVSNDCWGAEVYKDLGLPFETPLIGTMIAAPCYMTLIEDCSTILTSPLRFTETSKYAFVRALRHGARFPIGVLDNDVEIHFLHESSVASARDKWERRVGRIHHDRLFFKLSGDKDLFTREDLRRFDALPLANKIAFSKAAHPDLKSVVTIPDYIDDGKLMYERSLRHFDVVAWLNGETASRATTSEGPPAVRT